MAIGVFSQLVKIFCLANLLDHKTRLTYLALFIIFIQGELNELKK